jgi:hypothetical protein
VREEFFTSLFDFEAVLEPLAWQMALRSPVKSRSKKALRQLR